MELLEQTLFQSVIEYVKTLDWLFVINLIVLVEVINHYWNPKKSIRLFEKEVRINASFRVAIVGLLLAVLYYFTHEEKGLEYFRVLFESMIASMAIYAWVLKYILNYIKKKFNVEDKK